jgi:hypothetical protein
LRAALKTYRKFSPNKRECVNARQYRHTVVGKHCWSVGSQGVEHANGVGGIHAVADHLG